jgi:AI-2E family transporter
MVVGLFLALELIIANLIEPRLYGQSMGVSEIALLISAAFWAFLWGPIGLVLSSPLTVCLVVLGRYTPQLEFLSVLLGDEPALDATISFYQRLLARDQDEAESLIIEQIKAVESPELIYDAMLLPALGAIKRNRVSGDITEEDERYALQAIREIAEDISEGRIGSAEQAGGEARSTAPSPADPPIPILGCPAHDAEDQVALEMLQHVLDPARWDLELIVPGTLTAELLDLVAERRPGVVCIAAIPPGGLAHTRYLCKRIRARFSELKILVISIGSSRSLGHWEELINSQHSSSDVPGRSGHEAGVDRVAATLKEAGADSASAAPRPAVTDSMVASLEEAGADVVATTLLETRQQLACLIPILVQGRDGQGRRGDGAASNGSSDLGPRIPRAVEQDVAAGAGTPGG